MSEKATSSSYRPTPLVIDGNLKATDTSGEAEVILTAKASNAPQPRLGKELNTFLENWRKDVPESIEVEPEISSIPKQSNPEALLAASVQKVDSPQAPYTPAKTPAKTPVSTVSKTSKTPVKMPAKSVPRGGPSKGSLTPSASQSLKPQHTGQSVASTTTSSRKIITKTPATPKTPVRTDAGAKTPTSTRSKTPSLFAPTAASLAKSRSAHPPVPPPVKKATLTSDTMERLVKPTAASLSKAKSASTTSSFKSPPRTSISKSKPSSTPSKASPRVNKDSAIPKAADGPTIAATVAGVGLAAAVIDAIDAHKGAQAPAEGITNGHNDVLVVEETKTANERCAEEPEQSYENDTNPIKSKGQDESTNDIDTFTVKNNLEDIVNLLETAPVIKPSTEEIPDEENERTG